jgi:hypothetical protein
MTQQSATAVELTAKSMMLLPMMMMMSSSCDVDTVFQVDIRTQCHVIVDRRHRFRRVGAVVSR